LFDLVDGVGIFKAKPNSIEATLRLIGQLETLMTGDMLGILYGALLEYPRLKLKFFVSGTAESPIEAAILSFAEPFGSLALSP
jgi:hypothetical protein